MHVALTCMYVALMHAGRMIAAPTLKPIIDPMKKPCSHIPDH